MRFIDEFVDYAQEFTGCPKPFLEWAAILCLSTVAGRKHVLKRGDWNVYPNLWVLLIGNSSSYKSTGLAIARRLLREAAPGALLAQEYSHEKLLNDLAEDAHRLFTYDEAESFFRMLNQSYNLPMKSAIMTLWRDDWYERKTKQGTFIIKDPYLCWGGASTPVQIANQLQDKDSDLLSGMFPRFLIIPYFGDERSIEDPPPANLKKRHALVQRLEELARASECEYHYSPQALQIKSAWLKKFSQRMNQTDPMLGAFYRKMRDEHFHKIAMLSAFERGSAVIGVEDLAEVTPRLWTIEKHLPTLLERLTQNAWGRDRERMETVIKQEGAIARTTLGERLRIRGQHLTAHLTGLKADGKIEMVEEKTDRRPVQLVKWIE